MRRPSLISWSWALGPARPPAVRLSKGLRGWVVGLVLPAFTVCSVGSGCTGGRLNLSAADNSNSNSGNSDGSKGSSDGSNGSGNSGNSGDASKDSGESKSSSRDGRSSDSRSETSNTVTSKGNDPEQANSAGLLILTGALLLGATTLGVVWYLNVQDPKEHVAKHEREIRLALARGEGVFFRDVTARLGATEADIPRVASALRAGRARLEVFLGEGEITDEMGQGFVLALAELLRQDAVLKPRVDALMGQIERAKGVAPTASLRATRSTRS